MTILEVLLVSAVIVVFGAMLYGSYLIVDDKQKAWEARNGKR